MSDERTAAKPRNARPPRPPEQFDPARATAELKRFLDLAIQEMHLELEYDISSSADSSSDPSELRIAFRGADEALLLERNAELLLALEYIAHRWLRLEPRMHDHVRFDCGDYRGTRLEELKLSARVAAQRVRETGQPFPFNPMSPRDRRIVHLELNGAPGVRTISEGAGDRRHLVIYPAGKNDGFPRKR